MRLTSSAIGGADVGDILVAMRMAAQRLCARASTRCGSREAWRSRRETQRARGTRRWVVRARGRPGLDGWEVVDPNELGWKLPKMETMPDPDDFELPEPPGYPDVVVEKTAAEALAEDTVSQEEINFWFNEPEGGWPTKDAKEQVEEPQSIEGKRDMGQKHTEEDEDVVIGGTVIRARERMPLTSLQVGQELDGKISGLHLYLGVVVDVGAEFDGIVPIMHDWEWMEPYDGEVNLRDVLLVDRDVKVRVAAIYTDEIYRFRFRLEMIEPDLFEIYPDLTPVPHDWHAPIVLEGDYDIDDIVERTGRPHVEVMYKLDVLPEDTDPKKDQMADLSERSDLEWTYDAMHTQEEAKKRTKIANAALSPTYEEHLHTASFFYEHAKQEHLSRRAKGLDT